MRIAVAVRPIRPKTGSRHAGDCPEDEALGAEVMVEPARRQIGFPDGIKRRRLSSSRI